MPFFVDIGLPDLDGYELAWLIREKPAFKRFLLVAVIGYGTPADRDKALKSGFDLHCVKPIDPEKLFQMFVPHMTSAPKSPPPEIALPSTVKRPF